MYVPLRGLHARCYPTVCSREYVFCYTTWPGFLAKVKTASEPAIGSATEEHNAAAVCWSLAKAENS
jgi:hypothetical protein